MGFITANSFDAFEYVEDISMFTHDFIVHYDQKQ